MNTAEFKGYAQQGDYFVLFCLNVLYHRQTPDEIRPARTLHKNGIGFNRFDAPYGTFLAEKSHNGGLTKTEMVKARHIVLKHSKQLAPVINSVKPWRFI